MPDIGFTGQLVMAGIIGIGGALYFWWRAKKAEDDKARADTLESNAKGEIQAQQAEDEMQKAQEGAKRDKPTDPYNV